MVVCVGLDTAIDEDNTDTLGTRSLLYRAISRAHMVVLMVNELLPSGWLAHLTRVRLKEEEHFEQDKMLAENEAASRRIKEEAERQKLREDEAHKELEKCSGTLGSLTDEEQAQLVRVAVSKVRGGATAEIAAAAAVEHVTRMRSSKQLSDRVRQAATQQLTPPPSEQALRLLVQIAEAEASPAAEIDALATAACKVWGELRTLVQELILGTAAQGTKELEELTADAAMHLLRRSGTVARAAVELALRQWLQKRAAAAVSTALPQVLQAKAEEPTSTVLSTVAEAAEWQLDTRVANFLSESGAEPGPARFQEAPQILAADAVGRALQRWQTLSRVMEEEVAALALTPANGHATLQHWTAKAMLRSKQLESAKKEQVHTVRQVLVPEMVRARAAQAGERAQQFLIQTVSSFEPSRYNGPGDGVLTNALAEAQQEWDQAAEAARVAVGRSYYGTLTPVEAEEYVTLAVARTRLREGTSSADRQVLADKEVESLNEAVKKREQAVWDTSANSALYVGGELAFDPSKPQRAPKKLETADEAAARAAAAWKRPKFAKLELLPDKHGVRFLLSERQQRLIQLQHPDATRVMVKKLHGGSSGSLVLQTSAYDAAGRPEEFAVTKLDTAAALAKEIDKQDSISGELGPYAIRILRRPLYLGARGHASSQYTDLIHTKDADGAVVLELAGACWVLPEFFGMGAEQEMIVPFKAHLVEALETGVNRKNCEGVFDDLYAEGGPLQRLANRCMAAVQVANAKEGFVATTLEYICREVARSMVPDAGHGHEQTYSVPASLLEAATGTGPLAPKENVTKRRSAFGHSFVHQCGEQVWGDAACAPLIALAKELRAAVNNPGSSWLAGWRPLQMLQHGDLHAANVLVDVRGTIWLMDFEFTGINDAFCDAAKLISTLLFECLPCSDEDMLRRGCAVIDALIPADWARQLWEEPSPLSDHESLYQSTPVHALALSLAAKVQRAACDMVSSASRRADGRGGVMAAADVHPAAFWLPLLREALRCLRYRDLSVWQKRTAWHAVQRLSMALLAALPREPVMPPEQQAVHASLKLANGRLLEHDALDRFLREDGDIEARRYAQGQQLSVLDGDCWHDLAVISVQEDGKHQLRKADSGTLCLGLHAFNHAPLELHEAAFQIQRVKHANLMSVTHASIRDAISGRPLDTLERCIPMETASVQQTSGDDAALASVRDAGALCLWLHDVHARRQRGDFGARAAVLLTAPPAAGKTCLVSQLVIHTLHRPEPLVPLVIKVTDLQRVMRLPQHAAVFERKWNWADAYLCVTHGEASQTYRFFRQALLARRALLLIDGMDEGGRGKAHIERHVQEVLIIQGHPMLLTSRQDSLVHEVYEGCARLKLCPLTAEQQREVIASRLIGPDVSELMKYVQSLPPDTDGNLLSGNPLMLNMLITIFESSAGVSMPSSLQKVYEMASGVMLGRLDLKVRGSATADAEQLRRLLQEVALEVHLQHQRQIPAETLFRVAERLGAAGQRVCKVVAEQLANDRMPMLSVIELEPLVVQFSHLSFQEFFASQAICAIETKREGLLEPWQWAPWWGNAVRLGADCGMEFGLGLLRGAGLEGANSLNLSGKLRAQSLAAIAAVSELIKASSIASGSLATLALGNNHIGDEGAKVLAAGVEASGSLATLDLRCNDIGDEGAKALAAGVAASGSLTFLNINENGIGAEGAMALAGGVTASGSLAQLALYDNNNIGDEGAKALAEAVGASASLTSLNLHSCGITDDGATTLAAAVAASGSLARLDIGGNDIGYDGAKAIADAVAVSGSLAELRLSNNEIRDAGAKAIADALAASGSLTMLHLFRNEIGDEGATALAAAVAASGSLKELVLSGNKVGNAGTKAIADAIRANGSLTTLNINDNNIGVEGAKAIAEAVRASVSLALKKLVMPNGLAKHAELMTACQSKGVMLE